MVGMLGKVLRHLRLHAVLSSMMTHLSLRNAIQCGRSWQGSGQCGSANVPVSGAGVGCLFALAVGCGTLANTKPCQSRLA